MVASSGEDSASDAHHGPTTTMRKRRCLRRRLHQQAMRRSTSTEKNPTDVPSNWPFWWLGAAAIAVFVTPGLSSAILNPTRSMHEKAMDALWSYGEEQRWWMDRSRENKMIFTPNYDDEHFFDAFKKPRPQGVRYRDDATLHRIAMQQLHAYPVMVQERPRPDMVEQGGGGESSAGARMRSDPTLEDIDLIDVLWREDIEREKSGGAAVAPGVGLHPSDQVERDLRVLTEKSVQAPLTLEETSRFEDISKGYYSDFYTSNPQYINSGKSIHRGTSTTGSASSSSSCSPTSSSSSSTSSSLRGSALDPSPFGSLPSSSSTSGGSTVTASHHHSFSSAATAAAEDEEEVKTRSPSFVSDADVTALFEDLGKECGELNMLMPTEGAGMGCPINGGAAGAPNAAAMPPTTQPTLGYTGPMPTADTLLQNVSLSTVAPYNPANLTELDFMVRDGTLPAAAGQMVLPPIVGSLSAPNGTNGFPEPTQFWFEHAPDGTASYQSRQPVLNMSTLQLPPLVLHDVQQQLELQQVQQQAVAVVASANEDINMPPAHHELTTLTGRMPVYETRPSARTASMSSTNDTQSLGAASSSSSSSSSPRYSSTSTQGGAGSDGENRNPRSRFYGKLAPPVRSSASISLFDDEDDEGDVAEFFRSPSGGASLHAHSGGLNSAVAPRRRGRQSKDEQLAATNGLPVSAAEIAEMSLPDLQKLLKADSLTEPQRQLIRKIRRRGKNKVAARTCRQRRGAARTEHPAPYENLRVLGYSNHH